MSMIFETHAHYNDEAFREDREEILARLKDRGIGRVVNIASDLDSIDECLDLAHRYPFMYCALGIHPSDSASLTDKLLAGIRDKLDDPRVVAVGEIGLDYYWDTPDRKIQKHWFEAQLEMAREADLPVVIHSREAAQDTMQLMQDHRAQEIGGVVHCYSYSLELAREFVKMGFFIGIGGVVTFKNARKLKEVAAGIPLENIVLETDSPYLAPVPFRGKRNSSLNLPYVAEAIAQLRGISAEEVIARTEENAERLYRLR
jgi:TatD DNase family protein